MACTRNPTPPRCTAAATAAHPLITYALAEPGVAIHTALPTSWALVFDRRHRDLRRCTVRAASAGWPDMAACAIASCCNDLLSGAASIDPEYAGREELAEERANCRYGMMVCTMRFASVAGPRWIRASGKVIGDEA